MTKLSTLVHATSHAFTAFLLITLFAVTAACGSDSSDPPAVNNNPPPPDPIEGVATPSSVAVVTATNAQ